VDGGPGTDTLVVPQPSTLFNVVSYGSEFLLQSKDGSEGVSLLNDMEAIQFSDKAIALSPLVSVISATTIQNDYFGIVRLPLPLDQATTIANAINAGTQTETQYINGLLAQVVNTTIPSVAVESTMYGAVGTSTEVTKLATQFLPGQVTYASQHGYDVQVFVGESLGLVFAFGDENGGTA